MAAAAQPGLWFMIQDPTAGLAAAPGFAPENGLVVGFKG